MGWTIRTLPELSHLTVAQRRELLKRYVGSRTYFAILLRSFLVAAATLAALAFFGAYSVGDALSPVPAMVITSFLAMGAGIIWYRFSLLRIRAAVRYHLKIALKGDVLPVCLTCGYNLQSAVADRCPECGATTRVPSAGRASEH